MNDSGSGIYLLIAIISMAISMAIIPVMQRLAPRIGMVDLPDPRKVHVTPIPRVGGLGIVLGSLVPMLIWLPIDTTMSAFIIGSLVLLIFGVWDDIKQLGHFTKFVGQFIAVIVVVYYGDIYVHHFPYIELQQVPEIYAKPFTVIALVGAINALNHSDGLDGLAGGESLLCFGAVAYMAYLYESTSLLIIATAIIGGIFGFLRFNSHPARVFMGDGGSQFLGFSVGFAVILLTQNVNSVLSPVVALLLIGLPVVDIIAVFFLRAKGKMNLFKATKNHIHHRLMGLGFYHYESVMIIYSVQAALVLCAVTMPYENDILLTAVYLSVSTLLFSLLTLSEKNQLTVHRGGLITEDSALYRFISHKYVARLPVRVMEVCVTVFLIVSTLLIQIVPKDIGIVSLILLVALALLVSLVKLQSLLLFRLIVFVLVGFVVYMLSSYPPAWLIELEYTVLVFFGLLTMATFLVARSLSASSFQVTPLDYLVVIVAVVTAIATEAGHLESHLTWMALQMIILFYASELLIQRMPSFKSRFSGVVMAALTLVAIRGLL